MLIGFFRFTWILRSIIGALGLVGILSSLTLTPSAADEAGIVRHKSPHEFAIQGRPLNLLPSLSSLCVLDPLTSPDAGLFFQAKQQEASFEGLLLMAFTPCDSLTRYRQEQRAMPRSYGAVMYPKAFSNPPMTVSRGTFLKFAKEVKNSLFESRLALLQEGANQAGVSLRFIDNLKGNANAVTYAVMASQAQESYIATAAMTSLGGTPITVVWYEPSSQDTDAVTAERTLLQLVDGWVHANGDGPDGLVK